MTESNNHSFRLAVLLSGRGSNFKAIADNIEQNSISANIQVVVSDRKNAHGLELARSFGLETRVVKRKRQELSAEQFNAQLAKEVLPFQPDLVVLAGFRCILTKEFISIFQNRIVNIHPSLLPAFPGLHAQRKALLAGVRFAGCTVHFVTAEVDAGPIIAQAVVPVIPDDTEQSLSDRILIQEHQIYPTVIQAIATNSVRYANETLHISPDFTQNIKNNSSWRSPFNTLRAPAQL